MPPYYDAVNPQNGMFQEREQDPLDVNQQLMAPGWWANLKVPAGIAANSNFPFSIQPGAGSPPATPAAASRPFRRCSTTLVEPCPSPGGAGLWDRGGTYGSRRAFYSKFLILSGGQIRRRAFSSTPIAIQTAGRTPRSC